MWAAVPGADRKPKGERSRKRINRKEALAAFHGVLSAKANDGELFVLDSLAFDDAFDQTGKRASRQHGGREDRLLVVLTEADENAALSFRNLPEVTVVGPHEYGVYELLRAREVVFSRAAYSKLAGEDN